MGTSSTLVVTLLLPYPLLLQLGMGGIVFCAMMSLMWGPRAQPISFTAIVAIVLSLVTGERLGPWQAAQWTLLGGVAYSGWAFVSSWPLTERFRTLAVAAALNALAQLLRSRAAVLEQYFDGGDVTTTRWRQIDEEARLAALIQTARELVFAGSRPPGALHAQVLFVAIELRDLVLTSRLDLDLLGEDNVARRIRARLARSLRANAIALEHVVVALRSMERGNLGQFNDPRHVAAILDERALPSDDPRLRLLPAIASRQRQLLDLIRSMHELLLGHHTAVPVGSLDREKLATNERWPLRDLVRQVSWQSPVFRHAVRSTLAVMTAHAFAFALPWAAHPHWIVLSVAVVLRGNFAQTLSRRNDRILGTAIGCIIAAIVVSIGSEVFLSVLLFVAVGVAHAYVNIRYTLTAAAATLMALLQTRFYAPITSLVVVERLADTVIGAAFVWAFSFVLPSWSRRVLPGLLKRTLTAIRAYADSALELGTDLADSRQANREQAYYALELLTSTVRLAAVEPRRVRPPIRLFLAFIDNAQGMMAHLSSLRLILVRRAGQLQGEATNEALSEGRRRLGKRLVLEPFGPQSSPYAHLLQFEVPSVPADSAAFPWLMRRINLSVHHAEHTGESARTALDALRSKTRD